MKQICTTYDNKFCKMTYYSEYHSQSSDWEFHLQNEVWELLCFNIQRHQFKNIVAYNIPKQIHLDDFPMNNGRNCIILSIKLKNLGSVHWCLKVAGMCLTFYIHAWRKDTLKNFINVLREPLLAPQKVLPQKMSTPAQPMTSLFYLRILFFSKNAHIC